MKKTIATLLAIALLLPACTFNRVSITNRSTSIADKMEDSAVLLRMKVQKVIHEQENDLRSDSDSATVADKVRTGWGSCSGVFIKDNVILTAAHCVSMKEEGLTLKEVWARRDNVSARATIIKVDEKHDLALLSTSLKGIPIHFANKVIKGEDIWVVGNPLGMRDIITRGIVSNVGLRVPELDVTFTIIDATTLPGNSGGPVVDANGELVGILTRGTSMFGFLGATGLGLAVDLGTIKTFLQSK